MEPKWGQPMEQYLGLGKELLMEPDLGPDWGWRKEPSLECQWGRRMVSHSGREKDWWWGSRWAPDWDQQKALGKEQLTDHWWEQLMVQHLEQWKGSGWFLGRELVPGKERWKGRGWRQETKLVPEKGPWKEHQ